MSLDDQGPGLSRSSEREKGKRERTFEVRQQMGHITLPVSLLKSSLPGLAVGGGWRPADGHPCPRSDPTLHPGLGAVYKLLQPVIQSNLLSAVSSFYLCQSQVLCGRKGRQTCARPALQMHHLGNNMYL